MRIYIGRKTNTMARTDASAARKRRAQPPSASTKKGVDESPSTPLPQDLMFFLDVLERNTERAEDIGRIHGAGRRDTLGFRRRCGLRSAADTRRHLT